MRWTIAAVVAAMAACGGHGGAAPPAQPPPREPGPEGPPRAPSEATLATHPLRDADPVIDCAPRGPDLTLEGTIVVQPFGKGTNGAVLKTDTDEWVLAYRAEGELLALDGQRVTARGRECAKGGQAVYGKHFDFDALTPVSGAGRPRTPRTPGGRA